MARISGSSDYPSFWSPTSLPAGKQKKQKITPTVNRTRKGMESTSAPKKLQQKSVLPKRIIK